MNEVIKGADSVGKIFSSVPLKKHEVFKTALTWGGGPYVLALKWMPCFAIKDFIALFIEVRFSAQIQFVWLNSSDNFELLALNYFYLTVVPVVVMNMLLSN